MEHFREGERVRTRVAKPGLPVGTIGTIQRVFRVTDGVYDVLFDGVPELMLMYRGELAPVEAEHATGS
jgi:hypothetical protein